MSRSARTLRPTLRAGVVAVTLLAVLLPALPAGAATAPSAPTALTATVGDRFLSLSWSGGGGTGAVVRDVTGQPSPYTVTSGRAVMPSTATTARDDGFTNTSTATYAIWATESDGTPSDAPLVQDVAVAPAVATSLTLATSAAAVPWGRNVTFVGMLTRPGATPVAGQSVLLFGRVGGTQDVRLLRRMTTTADGTARTVLAPSRSSDFYLRFMGDAFNTATSSPHRIVRVLPRLTASFAPSGIVRGESTVLSGQVLPGLSGALLTVQRRSGTTWTNVTRVRAASNGSYRLAMSPGLGVYAFRVVLPASDAWMPAISPVAGLRVDTRDLSSGLVGDDVLALQRLLRSLAYDPGQLDTRFDYDVQHAVMAFQKVERLAVTGRWGRVERARAGRPTAWKLRYPGPARAVEISISRQVLVLSEAGRVVRIIDVSTGNDKPYTVDGRTEVATTPRGRFSVERKIDGIRVSRLGELYRPAYFYRGWAIHGSGSVPNYPASHGCVRVTNSNMDRLFGLLTLGTPVSLYDE